MDNSYIIDYKSLSMGDNYIELPISDSLFNIWEESEIKSGNGIAKININKRGNVAEMSVSLSGTVKVECDRCLDEFMMPFSWDGNCTIHVTEILPETDDDDLYIYPDDQNLDLSQWLYESVILSLPYRRVHPDVKDCNQDMISRFTLDQTE